MASHGVPRIHTGPRDEALRQKELKQIEEYNAIVSKVQSLRSEKQYDRESLTATSKLLKQNPEFYTIWNYRRQILLKMFDDVPPPQEPSEQEEEGDERRIKHISTLIQTELDFLMPLLMKFPKCYWIWNHRLFLLHQTSTQLSPPPPPSSSSPSSPPKASLGFWVNELALVEKMLSRDARNFHGWGYRRIVVSNVEKQRGGSGSSMAEEEFKYTTKMYRANLSNFSAWHNRSVLIPRILEERSATDDEKLEFLSGDLETMQEAIFTDPFDQSLHLYHHWLVFSLCEPPTKSSFISLSSEKRREILNKEISWMKELLEDEPDCRLLLEELVSFAGLSRRMDDGVSAEGKGDDSTEETKTWLKKLCEIDPMRKGRWKDIEARLS